MKERNNNYNNTSAVIIAFILVIACMYLVTSCTSKTHYNEKGEVILPVSQSHDKPNSVFVFKDNGHTYRAYQVDVLDCAWGGIVHDPDCECFKRQ